MSFLLAGCLFITTVALEVGMCIQGNIGKNLAIPGKVATLAHDDSSWGRPLAFRGKGSFLHVCGRIYKCNSPNN